MSDVRAKILWWAADRRLKKDRPTIIAIGGAIAKTSTKEAVGAVMRAAFPGQVLVSYGNLNTYLGVPLAVLDIRVNFHARRITWQWGVLLARAIWRSLTSRLPKYLVLELGTDQTGDLPSLLKHIQPNIGLLTIVGPAHLERYASERAIAEEESSLVAAVPAGGLVIVNQQDPYLELHQQNAKAQVVLANCNLEDIAAEYATLLGAHFQLPAEQIEAALKAAPQPLQRFHRRQIGNHIVLDDSYNANPLSMKAALALLRHLPPRRVAILGDMLELGPDSPALHRQIGELARQDADMVIGVGEAAKNFQADFWFPTSEAAARQIFAPPLEGARITPASPIIQPGDSLLVKGSRGVKMEKIITALTTHATA